MWWQPGLARAMRVVAILALSLLAAMALAPMATAKPVPPRCDDGQIVGPVSLNANCGLTVEVRLMSCPLSGHWEQHNVGNHVVRYYVCDGV